MCFYYSYNHCTGWAHKGAVTKKERKKRPHPVRGVCGQGGRGCPLGAEVHAGPHRRTQAHSVAEAHTHSVCVSLSAYWAALVCARSGLTRKKWWWGAGLFCCGRQRWWRGQWLEAWAPHPWCPTPGAGAKQWWLVLVALCVSLAQLQLQYTSTVTVTAVSVKCARTEPAVMVGWLEAP